MSFSLLFMYRFCGRSQQSDSYTAAAIAPDIYVRLDSILLAIVVLDLLFSTSSYDFDLILVGVLLPIVLGLSYDF